MKSSIIDVPRNYNEEDLFGIKVYQDALIEYIKYTDTPITIALQGEWGSGKTSLMNLLKWNLCDCDNPMFYSIWINTWQYSLMKTPSQAIISILEGIINQIGSLNPNNKKWSESKKKIGGIFKKMASVSTKIVANQVGLDGETVDDLFSSDSSSPKSDISRLKDEISGLIDDVLNSTPDKKGFTFYIDDLDRIDPPVAVEILELLKNIFDLKNCIFILAIDYDVVIKGLKPKFGELTDKNEREFRSFFDKIIQLPFSMPVANYNVDAFLVNALRDISFFSTEELNNATLAENLSEIARLSVGTNPRSLKRLTNTLSLISIINRKLGASSDDNKIINFALVCMQIAYPYIYNQLTEEPDFKSWNEKVASKLKLRHLTEDEKESLNSTDEFDEEWEKIVYRMCQKETFLSSRVFQISGLLNKIAELVNNDDQLGEIIEATMELSAVTNLKAFDTPKKVTKFNRDNLNYKYNGKVYTKKIDLVNDVVKDFISLNQGITLSDLKETLSFQRNMDSVFMSFSTYQKLLQEKGKVDFFGSKADPDYLTVAGEKFLICRNWPTTVSGKPAAFAKFLDMMKNKHKYDITEC